MDIYATITMFILVFSIIYFSNLATKRGYEINKLEREIEYLKKRIKASEPK